MSLLIASEAIKKELVEVSFNEYGGHAGVVSNIDDINTNSNFDVGEYGVLGLVENTPINSKISIGWMDQNAFQIGRINLIDGRLPKESNEIVAENFFISELDGKWTIGEDKKLTVNGETASYTLVGIIVNYSFKWSAPINVQKGSNNFPNLISHKSINNDNDSPYYMLKLSGSITKIESEIRNILLNDDAGFINERLFYVGLIDYSTLSNMTIVFQCIILTFTITCLFAVFSSYKKNLNEQFAIYKSLGFTNKDIMKKEILQLLLLWSVSIIISIPLIIICSKIIIDHTFLKGTYNLDFGLVLGIFLGLLLIFAFVIGSLTFNLAKLSKSTVMELLNGSIGSTNLKGHEKYDNSSFPYYYSYVQIRNFPKQFLSTFILLTFCIISVYYALFLEKESAGIWDGDGEYLASITGYDYEYVNNQVVLDADYETFDHSLVNKLEKDNDVKYIEKTPFLVDLIPLLEPNQISPTIKSWINENYPIESKKTVLQKRYSSHYATPLNNVEYRLIPRHKYEEILNDQGITKTDCTNNHTILYFPSETLEEYKNLIGNHIVLSRITKEQDGQYSSEEWIVKIDAIINRSLELSDFNSNVPIFIMIEEEIIQQDFFRGYDHFTVYLNNLTSKKELETVNSNIESIIASIPNVIFQDLAQFRIEDTKISKTVGFLGKYNFLVISLLSMICIIITIYSKFLINKVKWATLLANGMTRNQMIYTLSLEMLVPFICSIFVCSIFFTLHMILGNFLLSFPHYLFGFSYGIIIIFIMIILSTIIMRIIINKKSILDLIRYRE